MCTKISQETKMDNKTSENKQLKEIADYIDLENWKELKSVTIPNFFKKYHSNLNEEEINIVLKKISKDYNLKFSDLQKINLLNFIKNNSPDDFSVLKNPEILMKNEPCKSPQINKQNFFSASKKCSPQITKSFSNKPYCMSKLKPLIEEEAKRLGISLKDDCGKIKTKQKLCDEINEKYSPERISSRNCSPVRISSPQITKSFSNKP